MKKVILTGLILAVSLTFTGCAPSEHMNMDGHNMSDMQH